MADLSDALSLLIGVPFPKNFNTTIKSIVRRLFRIYAHLYNHHFAILCALSIEGKSSYTSEISPVTRTRAEWYMESIAHINTSYRHFLLFVTEVSAFSLSHYQWVNNSRGSTIIEQFNLIEKKELAPLSELNDSILSNQVGSK